MADARRWWAWLGLSFVIVAADQLSKLAMIALFQPGEERVVTGFFSLVLAFNTGAAFSFLRDVALWPRYFFSAGVDRAISIVEQALQQFGAPIYVRHEVVHNKFVVSGLERLGAVFVDDLAQVPPGSIVVFSAHGVSRAVRAEAGARGLRVFDATCPLVTKVHLEVAKMREQGREVVMIGHAGHPEVEGTMGQCDGGIYLIESIADVARLRVRDPENLAYVTQTTLSIDDAAAVVAALRRRFPNIVGPKRDDICYATQNRQGAVKLLSPQCDVVIVVGR